ncbi:MAG: cation-translocating P-type ATPase [Polyangiaceae bacterium]|nr:cation-translocating P-type ATPase [Polyangiaceae bacterium]
MPATNEITEERFGDPDVGLSRAEAQARLARYGANRLPDPPRPSELLRFLQQLTSPLVLTLVLAAAVAVTVAVTTGGAGQSFLTRFGDAIAIGVIVLLNAVLGYVQERKARAAIDALQTMTSPHARVRREGSVAVIPASEVVPGDILELEAGDAVPADARILRSADLAVEEAALTGESTPSQKSERGVSGPDTPLAERADMVFCGTIIVRGKAVAAATATGGATELGKIGKAISSAGNEPTPLEQRLAAFGKRVLVACLVVSVVLFAWGTFVSARAWHEVLLEAVSFAVAAIPEGLPAITTITLALGMQRMARVGAIIRRLPAVETLGAATILCVDKTGTLTQNQMTVRAVYAGGARFRVTGEGYEPRGALEPDEDQGASAITTEGLKEPLWDLFETAVLCNGADLQKDGTTGAWRVIGDPMEGALLTLAAKGGVVRKDLATAKKILRELPFDSERKRMTVIVEGPGGERMAHTKGSVDVLLPRCARISERGGARELTDLDRERILAEAERQSGAALRVLCIARRELPASMSASPDDPETELTFLGLVGLMDPPRAGTKEAVEACHRAGIRAVMITGDHALTATAIAREIGLWQEGDEVVTGGELAAMSDQELAKRTVRARVFARTTAEQKLRIVKAFKAHGHVVAMTGDGVNDAPALREAHIGVAMGKSGTDVARQAADMVITDDNFATIVSAIREGRAIFRNIQKVIFFLLSSNAGLAVAVFAVSLQGTWQPFTPLMILWINLVTNGLPALALGVDPPDAAQMAEPPRSTGDALLGLRDYMGIAFVGALMGFGAVYLYAWPPPYFDLDPEWSRAMAFSLLALAPLFHAWSSRSPLKSIFSMRPLVSRPLLLACLVSAGIQLVAVMFPSLRPVFHTHEMTLSHWVVIVGLSAALVVAVEIAKGVSRGRPR